MIPIKNLKGIGVKKELLLKKMEIFSVEDLIYFVPRKYKDFRNTKKISEIIINEKNLIKAVVIEKKQPAYNYKKNMLKILVKDESNALKIIFFNGKYLSNSLKIGEEYYFYGKIENKSEGIVMVHPEIININQFSNTLYPIYALTEGISNKEMCKWQKLAHEMIDEIGEIIPKTIRDEYNLPNIKWSIENIHFPQSVQSYKEAKNRLIFQEMLIIQWILNMKKNRQNNNKKSNVFSKKISLDSFYELFEFDLTRAQKNVILDIYSDTTSSKCMNRLIQGDVGCGKTIVAEAGIYMSYLSGYQSVMMAPTEILARQHYENIKRDFRNSEIKISFLSSSVKKEKKEEILKSLKKGEIDIIIGTHAVIQKDVKFNNLGLVITDEQHKFGVNQREYLSDKGINPHILVMTATPVPRSLALILYGNYDISIIDELPKGRIPIETFSAKLKSPRAKRIYNFVKEEVNNGKQVYVVAPMIYDSEKMNKIQSVEAVYKKYSRFIEKDCMMIIHGEINEQEKVKIINEFKLGKIKVLISTTLIEVGVDVPNASVMIIENAEMFGLSQLHQLRGRVGRGKNKSYCFLMYDNPSEISLSRIETMCKCSNGFEISEKDLKLRGAGEFFGTKQHGKDIFKIGDMIENKDVLIKTGRIVEDIMKEKIQIKNEEKILLEKISNEIMKENIII